MVKNFIVFTCYLLLLILKSIWLVRLRGAYWLDKKDKAYETISSVSPLGTLFSRSFAFSAMVKMSFPLRVIESKYCLLFVVHKHDHFLTLHHVAHIYVTQL